MYGALWGSTLALTYADRHPERVTEIVIAAVTMTLRSEIADARCRMAFACIVYPLLPARCLAR